MLKFYLQCPLFATIYIVCYHHFFSDEPDPPGQPQIVDWGPDFGEMTFTKPPSDGGAEITQYVIEMKEKNRDPVLT